MPVHDIRYIVSDRLLVSLVRTVFMTCGTKDTVVSIPAMIPSTVMPSMSLFYPMLLKYLSRGFSSELFINLFRDIMVL